MGVTAAPPVQDEGPPPQRLRPTLLNVFPLRGNVNGTFLTPLDSAGVGFHRSSQVKNDTFLFKSMWSDSSTAPAFRSQSQSTHLLDLISSSPQKVSCRICLGYFYCFTFFLVWTDMGYCVCFQVWKVIKMENICTLIICH